MTHWKPDFLAPPFDMPEDIERRDPQCNRCGSTDVRWRQQGGKWVLFSLVAGVEHRCAIDASEFGAVDAE